MDLFKKYGNQIIIKTCGPYQTDPEEHFLGCWYGSWDNENTIPHHCTCGIHNYKNHPEQYIKDDRGYVMSKTWMNAALSILEENK